MRFPASFVALALATTLLGCGPETTDNTPSQTSLADIEARLSALENQASNTPNADSTPAGESVQSLAVQPPAFALNVGATQKMQLVTLTTESGETVLTGFDVLDLKVEDSEVATMSSDGTLTALKAGTTILEVSLGGTTRRLPVVVSAAAPSPTPTSAATPTPTPSATATPEPTPTPTATPASTGNITAVSLSPSEITLEVNETELISRVFVTLDDEEGTIGALNSVDLAELSSSDTSVATVSENGVVTAVGEGTATITATYKGVEGTASVTVEDNS